MSASGILIRGAVGMMMEHPEEFKKRVIPAVLIPLVGLCIAMLVLLYSLAPETLEAFLQGAETPYAVIEAYVRWYDLMLLVCIVDLTIVAVCGVIAVIIGRKSAVAVVCAVCISAIGIPLCCMMYVSEDIHTLREEAKEDMAQIETSRLESATVRFNKDVERDGLPGPYTEGQPVIFVKYYGIGETTQGWESFSVLDNLRFKPDWDRMYNENKSVEWNEENTCLYSVTYTTNFHVVISIEPLN